MSVTEAIKVLEGVDASRRVGWAKAYSEAVKVEQLSRDLNVMRSERDIMRRALSFMYGFASVYAVRASGGRTEQVLRDMLGDLEAVLDNDYCAKGRSVAEGCVKWEPPARVTEVEILRKFKKNQARSIERRFHSAIARRYGFRDAASMKAALDHYLLPSSQISPPVGLTEADAIADSLVAMSIGTANERGLGK